MSEDEFNESIARRNARALDESAARVREKLQLEKDASDDLNRRTEQHNPPLTARTLTDHSSVDAAILEERVEVAYDPVLYPRSLGASGDPKGEAGAAKPGLDNISVVAQYYEGAVMKQGGGTYGFYNWCEHPMKASTYYNAIGRHLSAWHTGEDLDPKSGLPHMAHIRASAGIILDQQETERMIDDRPKMLAKLQPVWDKIAKVMNPLKTYRDGLPGPRRPTKLGD